MTRRTSIEAYRKIKELGLLSKRRFEIYEVIYEHGPLTAGEIGARMPEYRSAVSTADRNIHARLTELREREVICEVEERPCKITGMTVISWDVTEGLPVDPEPKEKKRKWFITETQDLWESTFKVFPENKEEEARAYVIENNAQLFIARG